MQLGVLNYDICSLLLDETHGLTKDITRNLLYIILCVPFFPFHFHLEMGFFHQGLIITPSYLYICFQP